MTTRRKSKSQERQDRNKPIVVSAKTPNQKEYIIKINNNDIVFCTGPSGSGKTFIAAGIAADKLFRGEIDKIIVTRPMISSGSDMGALPGDVDEKLGPYIDPMQEKLKFFLRNYYGKFINDGCIQYRPLELMRGATFDNSYMILDEAQNCTSQQIKMFITRMGEDSKVLINGDTNQTDLDGHSGLAFCVNKLRFVHGVGSIQLNNSDIQRNGIIGRVLNALEGTTTPTDQYDYDDLDSYDDFSLEDHEREMYYE